MNGYLGSYGAAPADINFAELPDLPGDLVLIQYPAQEAHGLRRRIVGAVFSPGAGVLGNDGPSVKERAVVHLEDLGEGRVHRRIDIAGQANGFLKNMPALCAVDGYEVLQEVSEESRSHPCIAVRSRFLLVSEYGYGGVLLILRIYLGHEVRVGAYSVVLTVAYDHGPVESQVHGLAGRNGAELGRQEIAFRYAVLLVHYAHHVELDLLRYFIVGICPASGEYVHLLSFQRLGHGLLHLILCQVRQEVGDAEAGLVLLLAYGDLHGAPVLKTDDAVEGERDREPLIFLYPAVIVCFEVGHTHALEQRIGFEIQSGAVYVADTYAGTL